MLETRERLGSSCRASVEKTFRFPRCAWNKLILMPGTIPLARVILTKNSESLQ